MAVRYNARRKVRLEKNFNKGTNKPRRRNKARKGFDKFFFWIDGKNTTKRGICKKYRAKVSR